MEILFSRVFFLLFIEDRKHYFNAFSDFFSYVFFNRFYFLMLFLSCRMKTSLLSSYIRLEIEKRYILSTKTNRNRTSFPHFFSTFFHAWFFSLYEPFFRLFLRKSDKLFFTCFCGFFIFRLLQNQTFFHFYGNRILVFFLFIFTFIGIRFFFLFGSTFFFCHLVEP